jgi:CDGSH-type Zn-finger protein
VRRVCARKEKGNTADVTDIENLSPVVIAAYEDGPLIVRGPFVLTGQDGEEIDPGRQTVALCRCGYSRLKPFCDGTHKRTGFSTSGPPHAVT